MALAERQQETKKPRLLKSAFEQSSGSYPRGKYLDEEKYKEEWQTLINTSKDLADKFTWGFRCRDQESRDQWNNLIIRSQQLEHLSRSMVEQIVEKTPIKDTIYGTNLAHIFILAKDVLVLENAKKQKELVIKNGFYNTPFKEYEHYDNFYASGQLFMNLGGISISDLLKKSEISPADYYNSIVNAWLVKFRLIHEQILSQNINDLITLFPNASKELIEEACGHLLGANDLTDHLVSPFLDCIAPRNSMDKEIFQKAKDIVRKTDSLGQQVLNTILNPTSPFFPALKEKFESHFGNDNSSVKLMALQKLGLKTIGKIMDSYRKARINSFKNDEFTSFYADFASIIKKYCIEENTQVFNLLTRDDVIMFVNENYENVENRIPTIEELKKLKMEIMQKSSKLEYIVDPSNIQWQALIEPNRINVKFYKDFPHKSDIILYYENNSGEKVELTFKLNTKSNEEKIDWDFLESPDDPQMRDMKNAVLIAMQNTLNDVKKQAEVDYQERQKAKNTQAPQIDSNGLKKSLDKNGTYIPKEKQEKQKKPERRPGIIEQAQSAIMPVKENEIKKHINLVTSKEIGKMLSKFSTESQEKIIKAIQRFNENGTGRFKALGRKHEEKTVYELRVDKHRVLVVEDHLNGSGTKNYVAIEIGRRSEIFKKENISKYSRKA